MFPSFHVTERIRERERRSGLDVSLLDEVVIGHTCEPTKWGSVRVETGNPRSKLLYIMRRKNKGAKQREKRIDRIWTLLLSFLLLPSSLKLSDLLTFWC